MGLFDQFPYTNFHELNLDWLLRMMKELNSIVENFVALNTIKYADPIQWNITTQYEANTVVVDPQSGTAYISTKAVPSGVALTNTDYWSVIFTLDIISANKNITLRDDGSNVLATFGSIAGDWLLWNGTLYRVSQAINVNEAYVVGYNLDRYTVEMFISDYVTAIKNSIGALIDLSTTDKDSIVNAINSIITERGALTDLTTTDNDSIVDAINSIITERGALTDLDTTDKTSIVNAINSIYDNQFITVPEIFGAAGDGTTDDTNAINLALTSNAKIIYLTNSYLITSDITIPEGKCIIGKGNVIVDITNITTAAFILSNNSYIEGISFSDINENNYLNGGALIYSGNTIKTHVSNCKFNNIHIGYCVEFYHSKQFYANYNYINGYAYGGIVALLSCQHFEFNYNIVLDGRWTGNNNRYPISISGYFDLNEGPARFCSCNYNYIEDLIPLWEGIDSHGVCDCEIIGNTIKNVAYGIALGNPTAAGILSENNSRVTIKNNRIEVTTAATDYMYGIGVTGERDYSSVAREVEISNNTIIGTGTPPAYSDGTSGIWLARRIEDVIVENNYIKGDNTAISVSTPAAYPLRNILIENNILTGGSAANRYAILINTALATEYTNVRITHNILNDHVGTDFRGPASYAGNELIEYSDNDDTGNYSTLQYTTAPQASLNALTQAKGKAGQKIRCTTAGTTLEYVCKGAGTWYSVSGTAV